MGEAKVTFAAILWDESASGARSKAAARGGRRLRLVEFAREFEEPEGCVRGHAGYVLEGEMEVAFPDRTEKFTAGDGILIAGGEGERHRVRVVGPLVRLVLFEDE
jgi:hypothetical protein